MRCGKLVSHFLLYAPFVSAEVKAVYTQDEQSFTTKERLPALFVTAEQAAMPLMKPGTFAVTWTGELVVDKRQRLFFSFAGEGDAVLTIAGKEVLEETGQLGEKKSERLRLNAGKHPFTLTYKNPESGEAQFRLLWEERAFPKEPIPPIAFECSESVENLAMVGRTLFARHLCFKCHVSTNLNGPMLMPELQHVPPILGLTGDRLQQDWLARWIANPADYRPDTNMPRLVADSDEGRQHAADMAAYLMETWKTGAKPELPSGDPKSGGASYHQLGCVACHGLPAETAPSENRVPLAHLAEKFLGTALFDFLKNPSKLSPHTRMPNFQLSDKEAADLTAFLLKATTNSEADEAFAQGDATRGMSFAKDNHCGACHAGLIYDPAALPTFESISTKSWQAPVCYDSPSSHLNLPENAGAALEAFRSTALTALSHDTPADYTHRQFQNLRCSACHSRDGEPAALASVHPESASLAAHIIHAERLEQTIPDLTHVGAMLHTDALSTMLSGIATKRPRPWLDTRMPSFANHAPDQFASGFAAQHGLPTSTANGPSEQDAALAAIGKELLGTEKGFGCITCHAIGDQKPTAAFEVMGINLALTHERLRDDYYYHWMNNPTRITPSTKMPRYANDSGKSNLPALGGDAQKQFEAIREYLEKP